LTFVPVGHGRYLAEHIDGARYVELPGADTLYWVGDSISILDEIEEFITGARGGSAADRVLTTIVFTDIVGSTRRAAELGDDRWHALLDNHDNIVRHELERFRGIEVNTVGDGFVAMFPSPSTAIDCAEGIVDAVEVRGDDIAGMAVHIGARVAAMAGPGEVLVSSTVREIVTGSRRTFTDRGEHELKGVPGAWRVYALVRANAAVTR
jgi:class 3 adenylate cyclase